MHIDWPQTYNNALAQVSLAAGQSIVAQEQTILATDQPLSVTPHPGDDRHQRAHCSRFYRYQAHILPATLWLTPSLAGCLEYVLVSQGGLKVRMENLIAYCANLNTSQSWRGFATPLDLRQDWLTLTGDGGVLVSGFGSLYPLQVDGECLVNPAKVIAFQDSVHYGEDQITPTRWQKLTGLQAVNCRFHGVGTLWCQSHQPSYLAARLAPRLQRQRHGNGRPR